MAALIKMALREFSQRSPPLRPLHPKAQNSHNITGIDFLQYI
jgi:hypothetical protein